MDHTPLFQSLFFFATRVTDSIDPLRAKSRRCIIGVDHECPSSSACFFSSFLLMTAALSTRLAEAFVAYVSSGHDRVVFFFAMCMGTLTVTLDQRSLLSRINFLRFVFVEVDGARFGQLLTVACDFKAERVKCLVFSRVLVLPVRKVDNWLPLTFRIMSR